MPSFVKWASVTEGNILVTVALGCLILDCLRKEKFEEDIFKMYKNDGAQES